jgi:hypothetical protein
MTRILFAGSRGLTWDHEPYVLRALHEAWVQIGEPEQGVVLVHGDCPADRDIPGGDVIATDIATRLGWQIERHPADWDAPCRPTCNHGPRRYARRTGSYYCPAMGVYRTDAMVALGADVCVTVNRGDSSGTRHCTESAKAAGIPIVDRPVPA